MTATTVSDAEYRLPTWADEIRRPAPDVIEYWKPIDLLLASDREQRVEISLVQNGPEAPLQLLVGEIRYTLSETTDLLNDVLWGMRIMQRVVLEHFTGAAES
jgi:hypothetical protein